MLLIMTGEDDNPVGRLLLNTPVFSGAPASMVDILLARAELLAVEPGKILFRAAEPYTGRVYVVVDAQVLLSGVGGAGEAAPPGDIVGLTAALDRQPYVNTAEVVGAGRLLRIDDRNLRRLMLNPDFDALLDRVLVRQLRQLRQRRLEETGDIATPVYRIMKSPVQQCAPSTPLVDAVAKMRSRGIGSLLVADAARCHGVLTWAGIATALANRSASPDDPVSQVCEPPQVIDSRAPVWLAQEKLRDFSVKYLLALSDGQPVGLVSQSDIVRLLIDRSSGFLRRLETAESLDELTTLAQRLPALLREAQRRHHRASDALRWFSELQLAIQRRVVELVLTTFNAENDEDPLSPDDFAVIIMGSGGRREMLLGADQDNAIIHADEMAGAERLAPFAERLNDALARVGYVLCPGEIMARNPAYRKPLSVWRRQVDHISRFPSEKAGEWSNIVLDFDTLYGNDALVRALRDHVLENLRNSPRLLRAMAEKDAEGAPAIGLFHRLLTRKSERGELIDIKRNGLRLIADAARILALKAGIGATNTLDRLDALARSGALSSTLTQTVVDAYETLLDLTMTHQIAQTRAGEKPDKLVAVNELSDISRESLRMSMRAIKTLQEEMHAITGAPGFGAPTSTP